VHHERVKVVGQAYGGGGVAALVVLLDQGSEALLCVAGADRVIERPPLRPLDPLASALGQLA
jgi:hypothetical protein